MAELSNIISNATESKVSTILFVSEYYLATDGINNFFIYRNFGDIKWKYYKVSPGTIIKPVVGNLCYSNYGGEYIDKIDLTYA